MKKKLIEVALPLDAINVASAREKSIRHGHPSTLHLWWARRPLAAARAVIFAQMVDDPSSYPDLFPTEKAQEKERQRLFRIIEDLVLWENTTNERVLDRARAEIWQSWRRACAENADHPRAKELFDRHKLPAFHDPFAGGGALPLEAQRLGLEAYASDLNPVAVLINKAMIEIPPKFAGRPPVNPDWQRQPAEQKAMREWKGAQGLAEDVRYYGQWMRDEAEKRIGHLYPKVEVTAEMARERPDLKPYVGQKLTVIAWLWARTVKSPNPAFAHVDVPLASTFILSKRPGQEAYLEPVIEHGGYRFRVRLGKPRSFEAASNGTKLSRGANFRCLLSDTPIDARYIKAQGVRGEIGSKLMAIVALGERGRVFIEATADDEATAASGHPTWKPDVKISGSTQYLGVKPYGMEYFSQLYTDRQLVSMTEFSDVLNDVSARIESDAAAVGMAEELAGLGSGGRGATAYAQAVCVYLGLFVSRLIDLNNALCQWRNDPAKLHVGHLFSRQAIPMVWDYAEANPFCDSAGGFNKTFLFLPKLFEFLPWEGAGNADQQDAQRQSLSSNKVVSTDPPYYDNVPYSDLSDFFYVWLRRSLETVFPALLATVSSPKAEELVAFAYRHANGKVGAERFFLEGMSNAMQRLAEQSHPAFPVTIYYAFKQSEVDDDSGAASTGWETFLDAVIRARLSINGTWPMRTELGNRMRGMDSNALASSIVLVCRKRNSEAPIATRREFLTALKTELPPALLHLQRGNIAPVDLAQAAIGPGMAVFTRYAKVLDAEGKELSVRQALALINEVLDEALAQQEGDFDADTRWALAWFEQYGFAEGEYGVAETLSKAKNTSVAGLVEAGILVSKGGKVRLLAPDQLPAGWDPATEKRLTVWEMVHHLVRTLSLGEAVAATLVAKLGSQAEVARELAYRLYSLCERKKRAQDALAYNALVQSWPEILRLSKESPVLKPGDLF